MDETAVKICHRASDLIAGRRDAESNPGVGLMVFYSTKSGEWRALVRVKPLRRRDNHVDATGATPGRALAKLLRVVQRIPLVEWK